MYTWMPKNAARCCPLVQGFFNFLGLFQVIVANPDLAPIVCQAVPLLFNSRVATSDALPNALAACCALCRGNGQTEAWFVGLQQRALEGEVDFVKAAAELLEDRGD